MNKKIWLIAGTLLAAAATAGGINWHNSSFELACKDDSGILWPTYRINTLSRSVKVAGEVGKNVEVSADTIAFDMQGTGAVYRNLIDRRTGEMSMSNGSSASIVLSCERLTERQF